MKYKDFILKDYGVPSYSCCTTSDYFSHRQQQEITKEHLTFVECSLTI